MSDLDNILLFGGSGFIGKSLISKLEKTHSLKLMVHNSELSSTTHTFKGDILKKDSFFDEIRENEVIINLLGQITPNESDYVDLNIIGGINLLHSCIEKKIKKIILISSINVYGENLDNASKENDPLKPKTTYGLVKMITEQLYEYFSKTYGLNITILRLAGVYGPNKNNGFLFQIIKSTQDNSIVPICYNHGQQQRDMIYVDDVIHCILNTINYHHDGFEIFNVSSGKRYSVKDLISIIEEITKTKISVKNISDIPDEKSIWADNTKANRFLKFTPQVGIKTGLKSTISELLKNIS